MSADEDRDGKEVNDMSENSNERYVDPNSGAAPQPGGFVMAPVETNRRTEEEAPAVDPVYDAEQEHSAAPAGEQPGNPEGTNASESGTTEEVEGGGNLSDTQSSASEEDAVSAQQGGGEEEQSQSGGEEEQASQSEEKDYSELLEKNVDDVQEYIEAHPEEKDAVVEAEKQGRNRKGITEL